MKNNNKIQPPTKEERKWMIKELESSLGLSFSNRKYISKSETLKHKKCKFYPPYDFKLEENVLDRTIMTDIWSKYIPMKDEIDFTGKISTIDFDQKVTDLLVAGGQTANFAFFHYDQDCFILNKKTKVQACWYKLGHMGRCNSFSKNGKNIPFTLNDWTIFVQNIRKDLEHQLIVQKTK